MTRPFLAFAALATTASAARMARAHSAELERSSPALAEYFALGLEHILLGFDHLAFSIGVVMIAPNLRAVMLAVTAFTCAHSLTLVASVLGVVSVSPRWVEPSIALSVAYLGFSNVWRRGRVQRYELTFVCGLLHGLGFASALAEIGVPADRAGAALALFNLGVEAGQLFVLSLVWPLLSWLRRSRERPFLRLSRAVNVTLIGLGILWTLERTVGREPAVATDEAASNRPAEPLPAMAVRPVYPAVRPSLLAARLCGALQRLPRERRAACGGGPAGVTLEAECTRMLSAALQSRAITLAPAAAEVCIAATEARYRSCDFMRAPHLAPLPSCEELWQGQLAGGAECRSSLECGTGLHCHGLGSSRPGVCGPPKPVGAACGQAIDPLAAFVPDRAADHPECGGRCGGQRCVP